MNVCAVRALKSFIEIVVSRSAGIPPHEPLPHEPKNGARFGIKLVRQFDGRPAYLVDHGFVGEYAECKHCGVLYFERNAAAGADTKQTPKPPDVKGAD
jgi:hypothetical protein